MKKYNELTEEDISANLNEFITGNGKNKGRRPSERYTSFDYCYNYFQSFNEKDRLMELVNSGNIQTSCFQLAFYLASWGMFSRKSYLLEKSVKYFERVIFRIIELDNAVWKIDADKYNDINMEKLIICYNEIAQALGIHHKPSVVLVTKIMLGIFGNVPAFDSRFRECFQIYAFNAKVLNRIAEFYVRNKEIIDKYASSIKTLDFKTCQETARVYTKAKIIDMIGFIQGGKKEVNK
ncbi:hypothetical protein KA005_55495 [bacterium]|nr:hypothetical protein [bacterium]